METNTSDASIERNSDDDFLSVAYKLRKLTDGKCQYPIHNSNSAHVDTKNVNSGHVNLKL
ncbi:hypothetical protein DSO57_1021325 [Entomophthora muscae]|uniref:Uncharacterized protein n=1 Tax=Entomophthora muscae TaxID=34485 RepID=A0ACC2T3K4_9FUNG|nr:hypothetical protein DSO57_1021325 [Entomophthora muscae]